MAKTKRKATPAQKAALAKGRAKLAAKRGRPKLTPAEKKKRAASSAYVSRKSQAKNFTDTPKKKARRARRRRQNTEPGYYPNPSGHYYLVMGKNNAGKKGYFNGTRRLTTKAKAQDFHLITLAKQTALNLAEQFPNYAWYVETVKKK